MSARAPLLFLLASVVAGVALRFAALDFHDAWADEGITWMLARSASPLADAAVLFHEPPLFPLLAACVGRGSLSLESLRALPAALGSLAVLLWAWGLRREFSPWAAAIGTPLVAVSAFQVFYAQELRAYSLVALLGLAVLLLHLRLLAPEAPGPAVWCALTPATAAMVYAHYLSVAYLLAIALCVPLVRPLRRRWKAWLLSQACAAALFLPWVRVLWATLRTIHRARLVIDFQPFRDLAAPFALLPLGRDVVPSRLHALWPLEWAAVGAAGGLAILWGIGGVVALCRAGRRDRALLLASAAFLSVGIVIVECVVGIPNYNYTLAKYVIWAYAPLALLGVHWMEAEQARGRRWTVVATMGAFLAVNSWSLANYWGSIEYRKAPEYREMAAWIGERAQPGDGVYYDWTGTCQAMDPVCALDPRLGTLERGLLVSLRDGEGVVRAAENGEAALAATDRPWTGRRAWLVFFKDWRERKEPGFDEARRRVAREIDACVEQHLLLRPFEHEVRGLQVICVERPR